MPIIDLQLVNIAIVPLPDNGRSVLRLNYQSQIYDLVRAFADRKLERAEQQLQQIIQVNGNAIGDSGIDRYLLVREVGYHSLWELALTQSPANPNRQPGCSRDLGLELQQASIWLFQELWLQWQDLLGERQLRVFAEYLLGVTPSLKSWVDLDRLLALDPLSVDRLSYWLKSDWIAFDRELYHFTQKKIGREFTTKLTVEIIDAMPDSLKSTLVSILDI